VCSRAKSKRRTENDKRFFHLQKVVYAYNFRLLYMNYKRHGVRLCVCLCVCVCARARVCVSVFTYVPVPVFALAERLCFLRSWCQSYIFIFIICWCFLCNKLELLCSAYQERAFFEMISNVSYLHV